MVTIFSVFLVCCTGYSHENSDLLENSYFPALQNYQVGASRGHNADYEYMAQVVHSKANWVPVLCTAVCIENSIFITAARCLYKSKVFHTAVIYRGFTLPALAFVLPSNGTKQAFDDIGFIVVKNESYTYYWRPIQVNDIVNRTDSEFIWFEDIHLRFGSQRHKVAGFAIEKGQRNIKTAQTKYDLFYLNDIQVSIKICYQILTYYRKDAFYVPCYHSCSITEFNEGNNEKCKKYLGTEGAAVVNIQTNKLLGLATWGANCVGCSNEMPVGLSIINSVTFFNDWLCARIIRENRDDSPVLPEGYYQNLCDKNQANRETNV